MYFDIYTIGATDNSEEFVAIPSHERVGQFQNDAGEWVTPMLILSRLEARDEFCAIIKACDILDVSII